MIVLLRKKTSANLSSGRFIEAKSGRQVFFLEGVDQEKGKVKTLLMVELKKDGSRSVLVSDRGHIENKPNGDRYIVSGRRPQVRHQALGPRSIGFRL